jgi:Tfp pilus assembly protein FimT
VEGAANELSADLQYARTESVSRRAAVSVIATATTGYSIQYVDSSGTTQTLKSVTLPSDVSVTTGEAKFTYLRGMLDTSVAVPTFTLSSTKTTGQLTVALSAMGRVAMCAPSTAAMAGYKSC